MNRQHTGSLGEQLAQQFLRKKGYRIVGTNYRCSHGEIDIVARHKDCLVFVEVRSKKSLEYGTPEESITQRKKERLVSSALSYLEEHAAFRGLWRIDVVLIEFDERDRARRVELIQHAVGVE